MVARCRRVIAFHLAIVSAGLAQEGSVTVGLSGGASILSFRSVDEDGRNDIRVYRQLGIPIGDYAPLNTSSSFEASVEYRFDRDIAVRLFGLSMRPSTSASFADTANVLSLERELSSTDVGLDILYFFSPIEYDMEAGVFVGFGSMSATAEQTTYEQHAEKSADSTIVIIDQDAFARYEKSKLYVRVGWRLAWNFSSPLALHLSALYKFAPLGKLDGTLREFQLIRDHTTTIEFDYSTFDIKLGLAYTFQ